MHADAGMLTAIAFGLALGARHAADPDHVMTLTTLLARHPSRRLAASLALAWGAGHSVTVVAVGIGLILLRIAIPLPIVQSLEMGVGLLLVVLGATNLTGGRRPAPGEPPGWGREGVPRTRSFAVGMFHGLAGTAAVALLAVTSMPTPAAAIAFLMMFSLGSMGGMLTVSLGIGLPCIRAFDRLAGPRAVIAATGLLSVAFGSYLIYAAGVAQSPL